MRRTRYLRNWPIKTTVPLACKSRIWWKKKTRGRRGEPRERGKDLLDD